jgi:hypothetical protein
LIVFKPFPFGEIKPHRGSLKMAGWIWYYGDSGLTGGINARIGLCNEGLRIVLERRHHPMTPPSLKLK